MFGTPSIDLFAARTNYQLPRYMSLYPDPQAEAINALFHFWTGYVYIFFPFNLISRVLKKLREDKTEKALVIVPVENAILVSSTGKNAGDRASVFKPVQETSVPSIRFPGCSPSLSKAKTNGLHLIRQKIKSQGVSKLASKILMNSWREKTRKQYKIYLKRYAAFFEMKRIDPFRISDNSVVDFLANMFEEGYGYSSINTARAAISSLNDLGSFPLVCRWIKLTLTKSGIDTSIFKAHSTRAAAATAAARTSDVSLVLRSAGWTKETTFAKFYNKPIDNNLSQSNFAHSVLKNILRFDNTYSWARGKKLFYTTEMLEPSTPNQHMPRCESGQSVGEQDGAGDDQVFVNKAWNGAAPS
ncbi:reverse transcriptase/ribonuclease h/methyltransferase [Plakobranchus ocellatus]|uniref:Reverse transcriptase/ribonuclease h/methyltransferase n=1 Tax=Plakobranchus ocellatus TaxID=259542 RepID=A0AAV4C8J0_9GAST|nr:reverse transcriptase/ribonuclease h/methyltransferase [Plakobranchus ocellatus]